MTMLAACHKFILRPKEVYPPFNHFQSYSADVKKCALYCNIFVKNTARIKKRWLNHYNSASYNKL